MTMKTLPISRMKRNDGTFDPVAQEAWMRSISDGLTTALTQDLLPGSSPTFVTVKLTNLSDGKIPYHVSDATGLADGPIKTDVDSAVTLKHAAVTVSAPIALSGQALSLVNDAAAGVTEIDTGVVASSDTKIPTSKAVGTAISTHSALTTGIHGLDAIVTSIGGKENFHGVEAIGTMTFNNTSHVLTLASITYWYKGTEYTTASPVTCDLDLTADRDNSSNTLTTNTLYYFYFKDATGKLYWSDSVWSFTENVFVATVFWNGSAGACQRENHSYTRDLDWHIWAHDTIGTRYETGFTLTAPTTAADATLQLEIGTIHDEDLDITTAGAATTMRGWYKASSSVYTFADYSLPYLGTSGQPQYLDTDTYTLTNVGASDYACYWVYASLDIDRTIYVIPTTAATAHNTIALARAETNPPTIGLNINPEIKLLYKFIYKGDGNFQESVDYRSSSPVPGGGSTTVSAGSVSFLPVGGIAATNVQAALEELDTEKGAGDVVGPASATDNALARYNLTTGKLIQDSVITVADTTGALSINAHQALTDPGASPSGKYLKDNGTWDSPAGAGDVVGPASATDNAIVRFDNTTGKLVQDSVVTVADTTGAVSINAHQALTDPGASPSGKFLKDDGTWATPAGTGDVVGPASAVDSNFAAFDTTTGKLIKDSGKKHADYEAAGAAAAHALLTTGIHGVGAGTIAKTADITATKLDDFATPDDNTDLNANTTNHGLLLKAVAPAANELNVVGIANGETVYANKDLFNTTNPAALGSVSSGTAVQASRSDHVHANPAIDTLAAATDITTLDASTSAHGLVVKAVAPASGLVNVVGIANGETAYTNKALFDSTNPAALGTAAPGTQIIAARRDHIHTLPVAGSTTEVQFNNSGAFGASSSLTWDGTNLVTNNIKTADIFPAADGTAAIQINKADNSTPVVTVDTTNARVGVGTIAPEAGFHCQNSTLAGTMLCERSGQTVDTQWAGQRLLVTKTSNMGDGFGCLMGFTIRDDAAVINSVGFIGAVRAGADNTGDVIIFPVTTGTGNEKMRIKATGVVQMNGYGAGTATFDASGNISSVSDERLKDITGSFGAGLPHILRLNPIRYRWKKTSGLDAENEYAGLSAQDVLKSIPEAIGTQPDGNYAILDRTIIAALINAVKELQAEIDELKKKAEMPIDDYHMDDALPDKVIIAKPRINTCEGDVTIPFKIEV